MVAPEILAKLAQIRADKTCELRPGRHVTNKFLAIPPHRVGVLHLAMMPRFLLADPVGGGKTPQALVAYAYLKEKAPPLRLFVVTLKSALFQWQRAATTFLQGITVTVPGYEAARKIDTRSRKLSWRADTHDIVVTTYHTLARDLEAILDQPRWSNFVLVFDEVQTVRGVDQTSLWPAAQRLSLKARYCWGLSATPIMNRLEDLFAVYEAISPGLLGGNLVRFRQTYLEEVWLKKYARWKTVGYKNLDQLKTIIAPYRLSRPMEEIGLYLPPVTYKELSVELPPAQRALYRTVEETGTLPALPGAPDDITPLAAEAEGDTDPFELGLGALGRVTPADRFRYFVKLLYCQLVTDAPAVVGHPEVPSAKWTELRRFLTDECGNGEKVVLFTRFERVVTWLCGQLADAGIVATRITGKESAPVREANRRMFQEDPAMQVMVIDTAGGAALDLQAAGIVVFYDLPWSWGMVKQITGRVRRIGSQHRQVLAVQLVARETVDELVLKTLTEKEELVDLTFDLPQTDKVFTGS